MGREEGREGREGGEREEGDLATLRVGEHPTYLQTPVAILACYQNISFFVDCHISEEDQLIKFFLLDFCGFSNFAFSKFELSVSQKVKDDRTWTAGS